MKNLFITKIIFAITMTLAYGCSNQIEGKGCIVGQKYIKRFLIDEEDPFEKAIYDTVIVLDIQNGYVKYRYTKTNVESSTKEKFFLEDSKIIP